MQQNWRSSMRRLTLISVSMKRLIHHWRPLQLQIHQCIWTPFPLPFPLSLPHQHQQLNHLLMRLLLRSLHGLQASSCAKSIATPKQGVFFLRGSNCKKRLPLQILSVQSSNKVYSLSMHRSSSSRPSTAFQRIFALPAGI